MWTDLPIALLRRILVGPCDDFTFRAARAMQLPNVDSCSLYLHIPFCRNQCPYCPYNTVPHDPARVPAFFDALRREWQLHLPWLRNRRISSLYIGGGTPTLVWDELERFLAGLRRDLPLTGELAIETNPTSITPDLVRRMQDAGIDLVSLGVQSFDDSQLRILGRSYSSDILDERISQVTAGGFSGVNLDLMFAFGSDPGPTFLADLRRAADSGASQITAYPLFRFPYSTIGRHRRIHRLKMPLFRIRRDLYFDLLDFMRNERFSQVSVWGFTRSAQTPGYSSVTRDAFLGLGPGAASRFPGHFYFNTFDLDAYQACFARGEPATALAMPLSPALGNWYWLYWRFYETFIPRAEAERRMEHIRWWPRIKFLLTRRYGWTEESAGWRLTDAGAFWIHLLQNHFILNAIDRVWTACRQTPFPRRIRI